MNYIQCPQYEHQKAVQVCMQKCPKYNRKICIAVEKIYMKAGYSYPLKTRRTK